MKIGHVLVLAALAIIVLKLAAVIATSWPIVLIAATILGLLGTLTS